VSEAKQEEIATVFDLYDSDFSGLIDQHELRQMMLSLGNDSSADRLLGLTRKLKLVSGGDVNETEMTLAEFAHFWCMLRATDDEDEEEVIKTMFDIFDCDGGGTIDATEFRETLHSINEAMSLRDIEAIVQHCLSISRELLREEERANGGGVNGGAAGASPSRRRKAVPASPRFSTFASGGNQLDVPKHASRRSTKSGSGSGTGTDGVGSESPEDEIGFDAFRLMIMNEVYKSRH
jgi:Ca2+-binding EF-hand superfamily protein